ncbi:DNA-binding transcriptional regulator, LysR family [Variovorax sp. CF079]|uniref:LysR family transcriptional regulator n=1 Tax=Variovorax sp. CF079 TaxID=1882774 RepID=UPI00088E825F|nr:LysR family transcriptional regulator [Variovorax sp. CF079]SDC95082.1 DNA-binding transcriptional regulator, LysR family [Variovorax sp. CF079]
MTLVQLRHLISLAKSGSFSKAAQAQHLTQPALSRSIRALEDELGMPLFDRVGRRNELTAFGREVLSRARQLVFEADELRDSGRLMREGQGGVIRIGMGSGPGAMLMTPFLMRMATRHPKMRVVVSRGGTDLLAQALRARTLDALVVDARSLKPAADLELSALHEMRGVFMCRRGHPLARLRSAVSFEAVQRYPVASTPLSDEVARTLVEAYGPEAHPALCVTLQCEEVPSLVEVVRRSDAVLLAIRAAAPDLVELKMKPELNGVARFGLVTLRRRTEAPALPILRELMQELLRD